ncbi:MAG: oligosaccharide flippase family protein [bacterium]|nr:oligosaccharide flippase family protein [bacterium]
MVLIPKKLSRTGKAGMLAVSGGMASFTSLLMASVLSRLFTKSDYAAYRQTLLTYGMVAPILGLGLGQALYYFIPREPSKSRSLLTGNLLVLSAMGLLFGAAMVLGGNRILSQGFSNPSLGKLLLVFSPYAFFALPLSGLGACLMSLDRVKTLVAYNVLHPALILAVVGGAALLWGTPIAAVAATTAAALLWFVVGMIAMYSACPKGDWRPSIRDISRQVTFGISLAVAGVLGTLFMKVDKVIVSAMCSPSEFAVYVNGATEVPLIGIISGSATAVLLPEFSRLFREGNTQAVLDLWHRAIVKAAHILIPLSCFLFVLAPEIMTFLFSSAYRGSASIFRIYLIDLPLRATVYGAVLIGAGKGRALMYRSAGGLALNVPLSVFFVRLMGAPGAALATVLIICAWTVPFSLYHIQKCVGGSLRTLMPWAEVLKVTVMSLGLGAALQALRLLHLPSPVFIASGGSAFALFLIWMLGRGEVLSPRELIGRLKTIAG